MSDTDIRSRLRMIRSVLKIGTQAGMASLLELGPTTWGELERGKNLPSAETLLRLADLGFSPDWILLGAGQMRLTKNSGIASAGDFGPADYMSAGFVIGGLIDRLTVLYADLGLASDLRDVSARAINLYEEIAAMRLAKEQMEGALSFAVNRLQKELSDATAARKRTA